MDNPLLELEAMPELLIKIASVLILPSRVAI